MQFPRVLSYYTGSQYKKRKAFGDDQIALEIPVSGEWGENGYKNN